MFGENFRLKNHFRFWAYLIILTLVLSGCQIGTDTHQMTNLDPKYTTEQEQDDALSEIPKESGNSAASEEETEKKETQREKDSHTDQRKETKPKASEKKSSKEEKSNSSGRQKTKEKSKVVSKNTEKKEQKKNKKTTNRKNEPTVSNQDAGQKRETCSIEIECRSILENRDKLKESKKSFVPKDGYILKNAKVVINKGDSVYDILYRICREKGIHFEAKYTPAYQTYYVEGIHQLYEFDCGNMSGWTYLVNGKQPNYGCSKYQVAAGDEIRWSYTCNAGKDVME